jgi:8-oxo-dGTP pyrophosphatase MutT (NUDIX family)
MASGIMFRYNGEVLLQLRSGQVMDGGVWGVPGGALQGTEGYHDTDDLERPELTPDLLERLWLSALKEAGEELGYVPEVNQEQSTPIVNWIGKSRSNPEGTYPYVTFVVDLNEKQARELTDNMESNWESEGHQWSSPNQSDKKIHPGVQYVFDQMENGVDVSKSTVSSSMPSGITCVSESRWTQHQVYDDGVAIYDVELLQKVVKPNKPNMVPMKLLVDQLYDKKVWAEGDHDLSPMMVLTNPTFDHANIKHMSRIRMADLDKPIIIRFKDGRVIDGYHRLSKAFMSGHKHVKAVFVQEEQMRNAIFRD